MKITNIPLLIIIMAVFLLYVSARFHNDTEKNSKTTERGDIRIMFYNVENLFDTIDDPLTNDNEFTPSGQKKWDSWRYWHKLNNIFKVIAAAGESEPPEIIGFAEIENKNTLSDLIYNTLLSKYKYTIVHKDSPDKRGIDAAIIYRPDKIKKVSEEFIKIKLKGSSKHATRDILYMAFIPNPPDTVHLFINHWPSRYGGELASETARIEAALTLKSKTDSLLKKNACSKIIIMGDFNDNPGNKSISKELQAIQPATGISCKYLYNLSFPLLKSSQPGTLKYQGQWFMFDQAIVSGGILKKNGTYTTQEYLKIFNKDFLLESDERHLGKQPFRTYNGLRYKGGFSDHLPVLLDLQTRNN